MLDALLLSSLLLLFAHAEDGRDQSSPIYLDKQAYTWTDKVRITLVAPSWNTNRHLIDAIGETSEHPIKVATGSGSLEPYRLAETAPNSGIFAGEVVLTGFEHDADGDGSPDARPRTLGGGPTGGFLAAGRDSAVTVSFEYASGRVISETAPIRWNVGHVEFASGQLPFGRPESVRVIDPDMNLNPESLDRVTLTITSDTDAGGIRVEAIETAKDSGVFGGSFTVSRDSASGASRLRAAPGDAVMAEYEDRTLPRPHSDSDTMTVTARATAGAQAPPLERVGNAAVTLADSFGATVDSVVAGSQVQLVGTVTNRQDRAAEFVHLLQILDSQNSVQSIAWVRGQLGPLQELEVSQSWVPESPGEYAAQTFVWESIANPMPLGPATSRVITVN